MSSGRRAELERKLTTTAVPRPPAGLADRIKEDIPNHLKPVSGPMPVDSLGFHLRIAASIVLVIGSALGLVYVLTPATEREMVSAPAVRKHVPIVVRDTTPPPAASEPAQSARVTVTDAAPVSRIAEARQQDFRESELAGAAPPATIALERAAVEPRAEAWAPELAAEAPAAPASEPARVAVADNSAPAYAPTPTAASAESDLRAQAATVSRDAAGSLAKQSRAGEAGARPPRSLFGISVDDREFDRIRLDIESGSRPAPSSVDVEALVNYFAGAPTRPPREGVRLEVEASPAPIASEGERAFLRFTVDTPRVALPPGTKGPAVASDVRVAIEIEPKAVASFRRIGDGGAIGGESTLHSNASVTVLYELDLEPPVSPAQPVARVRLTYVSAADGRRKAIERVILGRELANPWSRATRRHRLASLGAVWGETLRGTTVGGADVARRAEELAAQNPHDPRARQLAAIATASSRIVSGPPAGSGR